MNVAALVLAAGRGERLGHSIPKAFVSLRGVSLLERSLTAMAAVPEVGRVVPVVGKDELSRYHGLELTGIPGLTAAVTGGAERQDSVKAGLDALPPEVGWVAVHDAARCLVSPADVSAVIAAAQATGAAILALPARDTVKRVQDGIVRETPGRSECWLAQTPQVFRRELLSSALAHAEADGLSATDDAAAVERLGVNVRVISGSPRNFKITLAEDLRIAEFLLAEEARA